MLPLMTTVDVTYLLAEQPREASVVALANMRKVYGVRSVQLTEQAGGGSIRVEYDATRLTEPLVRQLLRRAGLTLADPVAGDAVPDEPLLSA